MNARGINGCATSPSFVASLAAGFIPSGTVKVTGERFTGLPANHPLGHYFDALYLTGFYYTFIGVGQLTVALLLLIPRTALLGAILYFPIILNICVLAYATRFEGTRITTLMVLANLYLLCWDYARLKYVLPFGSSSDVGKTPNQKMSRKFPWVFFGGVVAVVAAVIIITLLCTTSGLAILNSSARTHAAIMLAPRIACASAIAFTKRATPWISA